MKRYIIIACLVWLAHLSLAATSLAGYLGLQPGVEQIRSMPSNPFFAEAVRFVILQPLDHSRPELGTFPQRVFVSVLTPSSPVVLVTEGYAAHYGGNPDYLNELTTLINASQVVVEHRYFGLSVPENAGWQYLTVENAAGDHHRAVQLLKPYLTGRWISTGISKGGQTALLHRVFYPDDTDASVSYVAPFNFGVEDGRHEPYIKNSVGTRRGRKQVEAFQKEVFRRREALMPLLSRHIEEQNYTFRAPHSEIFNLCVLEYSFAFWQWGTDPARIPPANASDREIFDHFIKVSSPDYFSLESLHRVGAFFVQAARELGYYGYDTSPFRKYLGSWIARNYLERIFLPEDYRPGFDDRSVTLTKAFLDTTQARMIFIYGANDPWTASGINPPKRENILKIVQPGASHSIRIAGLDSPVREMVTATLRQWAATPNRENL